MVTSSEPFHQILCSRNTSKSHDIFFTQIIWFCFYNNCDDKTFLLFLFNSIFANSLMVIVNKNHFTTPKFTQSTPLKKKHSKKTFNRLHFNSITLKKEISWKLENYVSNNVNNQLGKTKNLSSREVRYTTTVNTMLPETYRAFLTGDRQRKCLPSEDLTNLVVVQIRCVSEICFSKSSSSRDGSPETSPLHKFPDLFSSPVVPQFVTRKSR